MKRLIAFCSVVFSVIIAVLLSIMNVSHGDKSKSADGAVQVVMGKSNTQTAAVPISENQIKDNRPASVPSSANVIQGLKPSSPAQVKTWAYSAHNEIIRSGVNPAWSQATEKRINSIVDEINGVEERHVRCGMQECEAHIYTTGVVSDEAKKAVIDTLAKPLYWQTGNLRIKQIMPNSALGMDRPGFWAFYARQ